MIALLNKFAPKNVTGLCFAAWLCLSIAMPQASVAQQPASGSPLDILVYGATGRIGSLVVDEALRRGHLVTAVSRDPASVEVEHENLSVVAGDLLRPASIEELIAGRDVIVLSVRGIIGDKGDPANALQYIAAMNIVEALQRAGSSTRLLHVGGSGSLIVEDGELLAERLPRIFLPKSFETEIDGQVLVLQYFRTIDDVRWTYATPARNFTNGDRTGEFRLGGDTMLRDERGRSRISRADFAVALIDEAEDAEFVGRRFSVAY